MSTILAFGDAPQLNSGYGRVNRQLLWYLSQKHKVYHVAWGYSLPADTFKNNPNYILIPPRPNDPLSTTSILECMQKLNTDYLFTSNDFFVWDNLLKFRDDIDITWPKLISYSIIDGPYAAKSYRRIINQIDIKVVASKYAQGQIPDARYIPHGVNTDVYKPIAYPKKEKFVYGSVNRNNWRKNIPCLLQAFSQVKKTYDDVLLYLVMGLKDAGSDIIKYADLFDLTFVTDDNPDGDILMHPSYQNIISNLTTEELVRAYNEFDVFVTSSMGEGFGLTTLEALSCGVPVIGPDNSNVRELVFDNGWLYGSAEYRNRQPALIHSLNSETSYFLEVPDPYDMAEKMIRAYENENQRQQFARNAREFALEYDWKKVLPMWDEVFE